MRSLSEGKAYSVEYAVGVWRQLNVLTPKERTRITEEMNAIAELVGTARDETGSRLGPTYFTFLDGWMVAYEVSHVRRMVTLLDVSPRTE